MTDFELSADELEAFVDKKYFREGLPGWGPRMRKDFGYFTPDDYYEALVERLIQPGVMWADVGCGRDVFPQNARLAAELVARGGFLFGIDPDDNVLSNDLLSERFHGSLEDCDTDRRFDVVTLRMVAEHIEKPERAIGRLSTMMKPGGLVVVYTPHKWTPMSIAAAVTPFWLHHPLKRLIWDAESRDTFPTAYRLNTHRDLKRHFVEHGFDEAYYGVLDDCRIFSRYRLLNYLDLVFWKALRACGLRHPEACILAVYRRLR